MKKPIVPLLVLAFLPGCAALAEEASMADLTSKLSRLYGEADLSHEDYTLWHGAEGTAVSYAYGE